MLSIMIRGERVALKKGTTIKLTRTNPYFNAEGGDYTLEVTLPMHGRAENRKAFADLHLASTTTGNWAGARLDARLDAPPLHLQGYALVTGITEDEVKVQIVAKANALFGKAAGGDKYIDELPLGEAWDTMPDKEVQGYYDTQRAIKRSTAGLKNMPVWLKSLYKYAADNPGGDGYPVFQYARSFTHGTYPNTDSVALPVLGRNIRRNYYERWINDSTKPEPRYEGWCPWCRAQLNGTEYTYECCEVAPQPFLLDVIRRVIVAIGYKCVLGGITETNAHYIIVANGRNTLNIADMLPHWTVAEFISYVQDLLGCVFFYDGGTVYVQTRSSFYRQSEKAKPVSIDALDDWTSTVDASQDYEQQDISTQNIDFAHQDVPDLLHMPAEVWQHAELIKVVDNEHLYNKAKRVSDAERKKSNTLWKVDDTGQTFAWLRDADGEIKSLQRVDHYGPLIRDAATRDNVNELPFFPVRTTSGETTFNQNLVMGMWRYDALKDVSKYLYSVDNALLGTTEEGESDPHTGDTSKAKEDKMAIAWWDGKSQYAAMGTTDSYFGGGDAFPQALGIMYSTDEEGNILTSDLRPTWNIGEYQWPGTDGPFDGSPQTPEAGPFDLNRTDGKTIATLWQGGGIINSRTEHACQFAHRGAIDPTRMFIIHSRRYACNKLELTIDENGLQPLATGYFYEIQ